MTRPLRIEYPGAVCHITISLPAEMRSKRFSAVTGIEKIF